jgi:hypothetical protein
MTTMTERRLLRAAALVTAVAAATPAAAGAQSVSDVLAFLATNRSVQTDDFDRDRSAAQATSDTISRTLLANLATLPVTTSSGAFVYRLNPELGTAERATSSFGPFFIDRAVTAGRGGASVGVTFQHLRFTSLDGRNLRDASLVTTANQFVDEPAPFDVDSLALKIDASIATVYGSYGVSEKMELGVAAPLVTLRVDGSRVNSYRGQAFTQARATATAIGLADLVVRTKYLLYWDEGSRLAAAAALRLPTGREEDLLGTGSASLKLSAIGSFEGPILSSHINAGYSVGGVARELNYGAALGFAVTRRLTAGGEVMGRWLDGIGEIVTSAAPHPRIAGVQTVRLLSNASAVNLLSVVPGVKWNVGDTWVLAANVTLPLRQAGLISPVTPFIGLDYGYSR